MEEGLKEFEEKFGQPAARTIRDRITVHNYPYGKPNRILSVGEDPVIKENIFAATSKGVSYLGNIDDFNLTYIAKSDEFNNDIPLGYTSLDIYERCMVLEQGEVIWENKNYLDLSKCSEEELKKREIEIFTHNKEIHYAVFLPKIGFHGMFCLGLGSLRFDEFSDVHADNFEEVLEAAKSYTIEHKSVCMIAKRLYCCNWH